MDIKLIPESQVSNSEDFITFKIIMIGDSNSEKWAILKRAVKNSYDEGYQAKIGFEFLLMYFVVNDLKIKIQIYDTCGQEMYRSLIQGFYRNTSLALLVYDITSKSSFEGLDIWLEDVYSHDPEMPIFIIGNKDDLENERQISLEEAKEFSLSRKAKYFTECSAKTGHNVENIFYEAAKYLYNSYKQNGKKNTAPSNIIKITRDNNKKKKKKCC